MKGRRVGSAGLGSSVQPAGRGARVPSRLVTFWCRAGHVTTVRLAADVGVPDRWPCGRCAEAAGPDPDRPPAHATPPPPNGGRTPLEYLQMRRSPEDGERLLAEALDRLHASGEGDRQPPGQRRAD